MTELSPTVADPLDSYQSEKRDKEFWRMFAFAQLVVIALLGVVVSVVYLQRPRVILPPSPPGQTAQVIDPLLTAPIRTVDAQLFFRNMVDLRYGWGSDTVHRNLQAYLNQCQPELRDLEAKSLEELIPLNPAVPNSKRPRLAAWIEQHITNTVLFPSLQSIRCKKIADSAVWNCYMEAPVVIQKLFPPFLQPAPEVPMIFVAKLQEVERTAAAPYGLSVGAMQQMTRKEGL